ncbi:hypothetical protein [Falseniella ignava]|uniref:Uncharacterized protein n=1 Tax=Falseniella ignava CCUG 37419 TaxID=883112 RepID=K1LG63_9LACT|nr:hypothetical protein [Falseniella ignava]EKB53611.1 hypothetical protein HMPREF9707_01636 [Falseniella ignava CCUG 37419]
MKLYTKSELLNQLRTESEKAYQNLINKNSAKSSHKSNAQFMNNFITKQRNKFITNNIDNIDNPDDTVLNNLMLIYYVSYIVMLEYRHKCWPYEYMAFSRRIGELWEPFCKLPFQYSKKDLEEYKPKTFAYVKNEINENFLEYIDKLNISEDVEKSNIYDTAFDK